MKRNLLMAIVIVVIIVVVAGIIILNLPAKPTMSLSNSPTAVQHQMKVMVASISDAPATDNMQLYVVVGSTAYTLDCDGGDAGGVTVVFVNLVASDDRVSTGDYWTVTAPEAMTYGTPIMFNVLWGSDGAVLAAESWTSF